MSKSLSTFSTDHHGTARPSRPLADKAVDSRSTYRDAKIDGV